MCCARLAGNAGHKKIAINGHHRTNVSGYIFATKARIDNRNKIVKQQCLPHMFLQYGELLPTSGWDLLACLRHPCKFQRILRLGSVTGRHSSSDLSVMQSNFAALNRGRHLYVGWQWRNFFISYLCQLFFRHVVGQALRSVSYSDITFLVR